jgi:hypothetical protein
MNELAAKSLDGQRTGSRTFGVGLCVCIVASAYLALVLGKVALHDSNPSSFAEISAEFVDVSALPAEYMVMPGGADGQFYLRLAFNPFTTQANEHGIRLDVPAYRQQRLMYPLLAWLLALGNPSLLPVALIAINYAGLCILAWVGATLALRLGRAPAWGLFIPLYAGFVVSLARDLTEIVATCFMVAALLALMNKQHRLATLLLCGAALSRETTGILLVCLLAAAVPAVRSRFPNAQLPWYVAGVPLLVLAGWQIYLWTRWGVWPIVATRVNFAPPLTGLGGFVAAISPWPQGLTAWVRAIEIGGGLLMAITVVLVLRSNRLSWPLRLAWLGYSVSALLLSNAVWASDWHILRALAEWHVLGVLVLLGSAQRRAALALLAAAPVWLWTFLGAYG